MNTLTQNIIAELERLQLSTCYDPYSGLSVDSFEELKATLEDEEYNDLITLYGTNNFCKLYDDHVSVYVNAQNLLDNLTKLDSASLAPEADNNIWTLLNL